jgi:hypothetical protein
LIKTVTAATAISISSFLSLSDVHTVYSLGIHSGILTHDQLRLIGLDGAGHVQSHTVALALPLVEFG